ncbi:MAG: AAA family ATPase [gamma proteobacterium symbiont of Bathyaustriella thionipta]|nr:AAA family ATPase [gamma proteobacterium symbiont of Bathyaustriella thionipta]MCU7948932.1 AAA family ATPase [gamma proteobacterium symbiont of Bathyaustriella thionipta]MCU7954321.1 AAA family ATPase [gamma proteobacterium symbiont of Bathyaustriella thionipta]MCU7955639.1 AAA family ATPase [gamma proteobacterium symbiont of Bathyaustriella thionipta]MCU7965598.1 AAA family ATPase [gamma proteobacterium symbiont of Bathyaustriella thionipta]
MYLDFFNLNKEPFALTPDTSFFLDSGPFKDALETLMVAVNNGEGFIKVVGEVGTGKTLLCRKLLNSVPDDIINSYIPNPNISSKTLTLALAKELCIKFPASANEYTLQQLITARLISYYNDNKKVILCIDEAQAMPDKTLEALRLLTNLETEKSKLLQVILFGQPELDEKLKSRHLRQFRQRVSFSFQLKRLDIDVMIAYITHRLTMAGYSGSELFQMSALHLLHRYSRGIPRLINVIVHKSLILCYGKGCPQITKAIMKQAIADTEDAYIDKTHQSNSSRIWMLSFLVFSALLMTYWIMT